MTRPRKSLSLPTLHLAGWVWLGISTAASSQGLGFGQQNQDESPMALPGMEMLVDGSILEDVLIPRYDENRRLASALRAEKLVLVTKNRIDATKARIEFYRSGDETLRGRIDLETAVLRNSNMLRSSDPVELRSDDLTAHGTGLVYQIDRSRGLLLGPATATMMISETPKETSMNTRSPLLSAAGALMLVSTAPAAETPARLTPEEVEGLNRLAVSAEPEMEARRQAADAEIERTEAQMAEAGGSLESFLKKAAVDLPQGPAADLTKEVAAPDTSTLKNPATVTARDGIFFDSEEGVMVLLKDVEFDHPQFTLKGADEVKVFFSKPPEGASEAKGENEMDVDFGEASKVTAVGELVLEKKVLKQGDKSAKASGRQMIYDVENDIFIIRGGRPWVISEGLSGYVTDPNGYIRVNVKTGDASFVGDSKAFVESDQVDQ